MRFIHTADWHLGCLFYGKHMTDDQGYILDQLVHLCKDLKPDAVIVAGDVYDRSIPPPEAVSLLDETLYRLVGELHIPIILIAGNHDSPERTEYGARLLASNQLHVLGTLSENPHPIRLNDEYGTVDFYAVPYADPPLFREHLSDPSLTDHDAALRAWIKRVGASQPSPSRSVFITHAFVRGGSASDSERPLSVGGTSMVSPTCFDGFNYVALGHLHRPQTIVDDRIHYSGSLLKYSFSEADQPKSVSIVQMDEIGHCQIERVSLSPRHDVRVVKGYMQELLKGSIPPGNRDDYVLVVLLDEGALLDSMEQLREIYPNILAIDKPSLLRSGSLQIAHQDHRTRTEESLFADFFRAMTSNPLKPEEATEFAAMVNELHRKQREELA